MVFGIIALLLGISVTLVIGISNNNDDTTPPVTWHILIPPDPDGENGWYTTFPEITICANDSESGVKYILFRFEGGAWEYFPGPCISPVITTDDSSITLEYSAIDNAENTAPVKSFTLYIDKYVPIIDVDWDVINMGLSWYVRFNCEAKDIFNGMDRVEMYINDELYETITGPGPTYKFVIEWSGDVNLSIFKFVAFDIAGNSAFMLVNGSDIISRPRSQSRNYQHSNNLWFLRLLDRFPILTRLLHLIKQDF